MVQTRNHSSNGNSDGLDTRAFLAVKYGDTSWVVDLPTNRRVVIGRAEDADIRLDAAELAPHHGEVQWDGERLVLRDQAGTFLNGKRLEGSAELKPGDEIAMGSVQLVVGIAVPPVAAGRRALTHHEFRERLWEEMARAARGGRPTTLVMARAKAGEGGSVAAAALGTFRAGDVVGTYAHDELEFLLPDTDVETARQVVDRVLRAAEITATKLGFAVAPNDGDNPERLLRAARAAITDAEATRQMLSAMGPAAKIDPDIHDPSTRELVEKIDRLAPSMDSVLLTGELSSGKGVFTRRMHDKSGRSQAPFVVVQCAALADPETAEREFETEGTQCTARAKGGTLLLDEIADLPAEAQGGLRALLQAAGSTIRVVSTTHRALGGLVERGAFDGALYDLISRHIIDVPPLRSRPEDIIPLATRFAIEFGAREPARMSAGALARLRSYPWPGNVLELRNAIERAVTLANGGEIMAEHLPSETLPAVGGEGRLREHVDSVERDAIVKALADSNHNQTHAARKLGISRRALIYKMEKYSLKAPPGALRRG